MEMAVSSGRIAITEIEKDAIRSATVEHNREIPLIIHQLSNGSNVHHTVRQLYSSLDSARARKRVYDFLQREVKKATTAKLVQHTRHVDPHLYMCTRNVTSRSSSVHGSGRGRRGYARRGRTRQGPVIGLAFHNNNEHEEQVANDSDEQQWDDEEIDNNEQNKEYGLTFDNCGDQSDDEEMLVDEGDNHLPRPQDTATPDIASDFQAVVDPMVDTVVGNDQFQGISQSTSDTPNPTNVFNDSSNLNQTNTLPSIRREVSVEYDTPPALNRALNSDYSNSHPSRGHSSINSRHLNARGRVFRQQSQLNVRRRRDSVPSTTFDTNRHTTYENDDEDNQAQEPRRTLTRVLIETADSLKEAAMMATQACALAMRKINEL